MSQSCTYCTNLFGDYCAVWNEKIKNIDEAGAKCEDFQNALHSQSLQKSLHKTPKLVGKKVRVFCMNTGKSYWGGFRQGAMGKYATFNIDGESYTIMMSKPGIELFYQESDQSDIDEYEENLKILETTKDE